MRHYCRHSNLNIVLASGQRISGLSEKFSVNGEWVGLEGFDYDDDDSTVSIWLRDAKMI